jgi:hypothetical protein
VLLLAALLPVLAAPGLPGGGLGRPWPLPADPARDALRDAYFAAHCPAALAPDGTALPLHAEMVVLHWTAGPTASSAWNTFAAPALTARPELSAGGRWNVGAHFLVERDGTVHALLPLGQPARHAIGLNHVAIGIENVGDGERWPLTPAQVAANAALVRSLAATLPIRWLIGHHEAARFAGHPPHCEQDPRYRTQKPDPGPAFMDAVRAALLPLVLGGPP